VIKASGGQYPLGTTTTPWIAFFDPDETVHPQQGLYVVWILRADRTAWTLSLNMGTEQRFKLLAANHISRGDPESVEARGLGWLRHKAASIRAEMPGDLRQGWDDSMSLHSTGRRQRRYEAATIVAKTYPLDSLPPDDVLAEDLSACCVRLQEAVLADDRLKLRDAGSGFASISLTPQDRREYIFEPGVDRPQTVRTASSIERRPRHETGLRRYGLWLQERGLLPATKVYPRDFVVRGDPEWVGEYKVVYGTDVTRATREAYSQLKEYRYFMYPRDSSIGLLAVFSAPVGDGRVEWLNAEGIAVVWDDRCTWRGCLLATAAGLGS